jgi:hypothetical protein
MKSLIKIISFTATLTFLSGCFDDPGSDEVFDGSISYVELKSATPSSGSETFTYLRENVGAILDAGFEVVLTAATSNGADISFEIDPSSTAVDGLHYNLNGTSVVIDPGEFSAQLPITIMPDNIEAMEKWTIVVNITSASVDISDEYGSAEHTIQISCPPNIPLGTYTTVLPDPTEDPDNCQAFSYAGDQVEVTYNEGTGLYTISDADIGYFAGDYVVPTDFKNVCDVLELQGNPSAPYGISFVGSGIFIPGGGANGNGRIVFQCYYDETYAGENFPESVAYDAP